MSKLSKQKAFELDKLFKKMIIWDGINTLGHIDVLLVAKEIDELKHKSDEYIKDLMYIARQEQDKIPNMFSGDMLLSINESSISDFLRQGGFKSIFDKNKLHAKKDNFRFWSIFIFTFATLIISIYQVYFSDKSFPSKTQIEKQKQQKQKPLHLDSTIKEVPKTNPKIDTANK